LFLASHRVAASPPVVKWNIGRAKAKLRQ
jgi:hypothetical protein